MISLDCYNCKHETLSSEEKPCSICFVNGKAGPHNYWEPVVKPFPTQSYYDNQNSMPEAHSHYDVGDIPTIAFIKAKLTPEQYKGFCLGNVLKYAARLNHKGAPEKDVNKLLDYADWLSKTYKAME